MFRLIYDGITVILRKIDLEFATILKVLFELI